MTITIATLFFVGLIVAGAVGLIAGLSIASYIYRNGTQPVPGSDSMIITADGTRLVFYRNGVTYVYNLSTPGDISTATFSKSY